VVPPELLPSLCLALFQTPQLCEDHVHFFLTFFSQPSEATLARAELDNDLSEIRLNVRQDLLQIVDFLMQLVSRGLRVIAFVGGVVSKQLKPVKLGLLNLFRQFRYLDFAHQYEVFDLLVLIAQRQILLNFGRDFALEPIDCFAGVQRLQPGCLACQLLQLLRVDVESCGRYTTLVGVSLFITR